MCVYMCVHVCACVCMSVCVSVSQYIAIHLLHHSFLEQRVAFGLPYTPVHPYQRYTSCV